MNNNFLLKIKLNTVDDVKNFCRLAMNSNSDVFVHSDKFIVDGTSLLGLFSLNLTKELSMEIVEKEPGEKDKLVMELEKLNIVLQD